MSLVQESSVVYHGIPSPRLNKGRAFIELSDKVNGLNDGYVIMREVLDGLLPVLEAHAGLFAVSTDLLYTKHLHPSEAVERLERSMRERGDKVFSVLASEQRRRTHVANGLLLTPLMWQGAPIGLIAFDRPDQRLLPSDRAGLHALSNQLAAIFGLKLSSSSLSRQHVAQQHEIRNAIAVQQSLLPSIPPSHSCGLSIATYTQSAEFVGGDYFDLILVEGKKMGIVVADVEGKGVPAALFGNLLRTTTHFLTHETPSTSAVMTKINSILHKKAVSSRKLFTMFYALFDPETKILTYTGSGHVSPMVIRGDGKETIRLYSDGTLIGVDPVQRFSEHSVQLQADDVVVYFTDGVTEHRNRKLEAYGEERLTHLVQQRKTETADMILNSLKADLARFNSLAPTDDLTLVVTKVL